MSGRYGEEMRLRVWAWHVPHGKLTPISTPCLLPLPHNRSRYLARERDAWAEAEEKGERERGTWLEMVPLNSRDLIPSPVLTRAAPYQRQTEKYSTSMMGAFSDSTVGSAGSEGVTPQRRHSGRYTPIQPSSHMYNYESIPVAPLSPREWQWHGGLGDTRAWTGSVGHSDSDSAAAVTRVSSTGSAPTSASATATERAIRSQQAHVRAQVSTHHSYGSLV